MFSQNARLKEQYLGSDVLDRVKLTGSKYLEGELFRLVGCMI
jgi:hypothetical protein